MTFLQNSIHLAFFKQIHPYSRTSDSPIIRSIPFHSTPSCPFCSVLYIPTISFYSFYPFSFLLFHFIPSFHAIFCPISNSLRYVTQLNILLHPCHTTSSQSLHRLVQGVPSALHLRLRHPPLDGAAGSDARGLPLLLPKSLLSRYRHRLAHLLCM